CKNLLDFAEKADEVSKRIKSVGDYLSIEEFFDIYGNLNDYLIIPHYDKKPSLPLQVLTKIRSYITVGEVDSPKKFIRMVKDDSELVPVIFSDVRIRRDISKFPSRHTFVDCGDISLSSLKLSLR